MIVNKGFSFSNIVGKYAITADKAQMNSRTEDNLIIQTIYPGNLKKLYSYNSYDDGSIAYEFAAIDINDLDDIISFCNKYGLILSNRLKANVTNDYIFFSSNKIDFSEVVPASQYDYIYLHNFRREVTIMNCLLGLKSALDADDAVEIVKNIVPVLIAYTNKTCVPFDTETENFNYYFYRFMKGNNENNRYYLKDEYYHIHKAVLDYLNSLDDYVVTVSMYGDEYIENRGYSSIFHSTWQAYHGLLSKLLSVTDVLTDCNGENIEYSVPITDELLDKADITNEKLKIYAAICISDLMNSQTRFITPVLNLENGSLISDWQISSLLEAMYMELMVTFSPNTQIKKCANPTCNFHFDVGIGNNRKIYCSRECAQLMAKRKQRFRDKAKKKTSTVQDNS